MTWNDLLYVVSSILEGIVMYLAFLLVAKNLFFEKGISDIVQISIHIFTVIGLVAVGIFATPYTEAFIFMMTFVWLCFEKSDPKFIRSLLAFPIMGIVYGVFVPFAFLPESIFDIDTTSFLYAKIIISTLVIYLVVWFLYRIEKKLPFGKNKVMQEIEKIYEFDSHDRELSTVEKTLLYSIGILELAFTVAVRIPFMEIVATSSTQDLYLLVRSFLFLLGVSTVIITGIVIAVVLIGNKRALYSKQVSGMQFNIIMMMAEIVENRDKDTGGHIQRTAKYVEIITNALRRGPYSHMITSHFIEDIKIAAPLHDIGKIHVSDVILNKPGRLTDEEFAIMRTHADEGRKLLTHAKNHFGEISYLNMAIDMAAFHHEWWDGSSRGYPDHISGEEIPLCARIMAVADVFDALTARRCYKEPMQFRQAKNIIKEERGTHFDPIVVDAFLDAIDKIKEAYREFEAESPSFDNIMEKKS